VRSPFSPLLQFRLSSLFLLALQGGVAELSSVRHFVDEAIKKMELDEFLSMDLERAGYGGVEVTKTPLGTRLTIYAMKPGIVIGRRGESIRELTRILEDKFNVNNPQIAVEEVEIPELNAYIMATRISSALQRGIHYRRSGYWALNRIMEAGALGVEITTRGKLTSRRARYEKFKAGYLPKAGEPSIRNLRRAVVHVKVKSGLCGINVKIMPPGVIFPDKVEILPQPTVEEGETTLVPTESKEEKITEKPEEKSKEPVEVEAVETDKPVEAEASEDAKNADTENA